MLTHSVHGKKPMTTTYMRMWTLAVTQHFRIMVILNVGLMDNNSDKTLNVRTYRLNAMDLDNIVAYATMKGMQLASDMMMPEGRLIREKALISFLKVHGLRRSDLNHWIDLGWVTPLYNGERSPTLYRKNEITDAMLKCKMADSIIIE